MQSCLCRCLNKNQKQNVHPLLLFLVPSLPMQSSISPQWIKHHIKPRCCSIVPAWYPCGIRSTTPCSLGNLSGYLRYHVPPSGLRVHPLRRHAASYQHTKLGRSWDYQQNVSSKDHVSRLYNKETWTYHGTHMEHAHSNTSILNE